MFISNDMITVFTVSAVLSFVISVSLLLIIAAKRGYMRVGKARAGQVFLLPHPQSTTMPKPSAPPAVEMTPLTNHSA